jgi:ribosomal protein S27E
MSEIRYEVKTFYVNYRCEECSNGLMNWLNTAVFTSTPITYPHRCNLCGATKVLPETYPHYEQIHEPRRIETSREAPPR